MFRESRARPAARSPMDDLDVVNGAPFERLVPNQFKSSKETLNGKEESNQEGDEEGWQEGQARKEGVAAGVPRSV
jgi:hypothetical protein